MALNDPKLYSYKPAPVGPIKLQTRSATRARLTAGGTFFRSRELGQSANQIKVAVLEDFSDVLNPMGVFITHHTGLMPPELFSSGMNVPEIVVYDFKLPHDQEVRIERDTDGVLGAVITGIRWQIAGDIGILVKNLGTVVLGKLFSAPGLAFKISSTEWSENGVLVLKPRVRRYPLVLTSSTDPTSMMSAMGGSIDALRDTVNQEDPWIIMPGRVKAVPDTVVDTTMNADKFDDGADAVMLTAFEPMNLSGGDGLPSDPGSINTGPERSLIHLNYAELDDGSLGTLNQVFEWVGSSATAGSWKRYS